MEPAQDAPGDAPATQDRRSRISDLALRVILYAAAVLVPIAAFAFARSVGASWPASLAFLVVGALAVYLSSRRPTTDEKAAELGRGVVVTLILTAVLAWVQHRSEVRDARDSLALTLSSGSSFPGIDLHGRNMTGFYLAAKKLDGANLSHVNLKDAMLRSTSLQGADLEHIDLTGANLEGANLAITPNGSPANLESARLAGANLTVAQLKGAKLRHANLRNADLAGADLRNTDLRDADLRGASLLGTDLRLAVLAGADLRGALFDADFRPARLEGANLTGARFDRTTTWPAGFDPEAAIAAAARPVASPPVPADATVDRVRATAEGASIVLEGGGIVRLLGFSPPAQRPPECYTAEARTDIKSLLTPGQRVRYTVGFHGIDKFHRTLGYVWTDDGTLVNQKILARGDARVLIVKPNIRYERTLRRAQVQAAGAGLGLWGACK